MKISFIHIPKNGGSSIAKIVKKNQNNPLKYYFHSVDPFKLDKKRPNLYILRDPIDRFCSAVNYALQKWGHQGCVKECIENGINTPEKFIQCYKDKNNPYHHLVKDEIENIKGIHNIGKKILFYKWTYNPQIDWIREKNSIFVLFENMNEELQYIFRKINLNVVISKENSTKKKDNYLSQDSIDFLHELYKKDFVFINKIKNMSKKNRLLI
jgi:hypothetical protein